MTNSMYGILFTTLVGVFFLITVLLSKFVSKKKNFLVFLLGFTFSIMMGMVIFSLYPEAKEIFINKKHYNLIILVFTLIGFLFTYFFDKLVPDHHKEGNITFNNNNLMHISLMTSIALIIHNFVEGAGLYTITLSSVKSGFIMFLATVIHNVPFALTIVLSLNGKVKGKNLIVLILLILSTLMGGIFVHLFTLTNIYLGILICVTMGMILYISLIEILEEIVHEGNNKYNYIGIIIGILLVILLFLL